MLAQEPYIDKTDLEIEKKKISIMYYILFLLFRCHFNITTANASDQNIVVF